MNASEVPAEKLAEVKGHLLTAARKRSNGSVTMRLILINGAVVRAAVVPDFEEPIGRPGVKAPQCFVDDSGKDAA